MSQYGRGASLATVLFRDQRFAADAPHLAVFRQDVIGPPGVGDRRVDHGFRRAFGIFARIKAALRDDGIAPDASQIHVADRLGEMTLPDAEIQPARIDTLRLVVVVHEKVRKREHIVVFFPLLLPGICRHGIWIEVSKPFVNRSRSADAVDRGPHVFMVGHG